MRTLMMANFLARYSTRKWNRSRILRVMCRLLYRKMGELYIFWHRVAHGGHGDGWPINTYPWPYVDPRFAPWEENDTICDYTLVTDSANFVIRRSASYVAWKIFELTGRWIKKREDRSGGSCHAKDWQKLLALNGYDEVVEYPERGHNYVGILSHYGELGLVVWFEGINALSQPGHEMYIVTTYDNFQYTVHRQFSGEDTLWIKIC